jgi:uncharacterized protein YkwD
LRRLTVVLSCCVSILAAAAPAASAATPCAGAASTLEQLGAAAARRATLCALNRERTARGLRALRLDARLTRAAQGHSSDMVAKRYFAHGDFGGRIRHSGWTRHRRSWTIGENLGYGTTGAATPASIVSAWMHSAGHRANILEGRFHFIGIGIASGTPDGQGGATYSTDFGG